MRGGLPSFLIPHPSSLIPQSSYRPAAETKLAETQPSDPPGSRTFFQTLPSARSSGPTRSRSVPSGRVLRRAACSPALARRLTPRPRVLATFKRSAALAEAAWAGGGIGVGATVGAGAWAACPAAAAGSGCVGTIGAARTVSRCSDCRVEASHETPTTTAIASTRPAIAEGQ